MSPAPLQFIKRCVEFIPLAASEKSPLQRVMKAFIVLAIAPPGKFSPGSLNVQPIQDGMMPGAVVRPLADHRVEPLPVLRCQRLAPVVDVGQDDAHAPV